MGLLCGEALSQSSSRAQGGSGKETDLSGGSKHPALDVPVNVTMGVDGPVTPLPKSVVFRARPGALNVVSVLR